MRKNTFQICIKGGCHRLTKDLYCDTHVHLKREQVQTYRQNERPRENKPFYDSKEWKRARQQAISRDHGLCQDCMDEGTLKAFDVVDHVEEIKDRPDLKLDLDNLRCLCHTHHNQKTRRVREKRTNNDFSF